MAQTTESLTQDAAAGFAPTTFNIVLIVALAVTLVILGLIACFIVRRRRRKMRETATPPPDTPRAQQYEATSAPAAESWRDRRVRTKAKQTPAAPTSPAAPSPATIAPPAKSPPAESWRARRARSKVQPTDEVEPAAEVKPTADVAPGADLTPSRQPGTIVPAPKSPAAKSPARESWRARRGRTKVKPTDEAKPALDPATIVSPSRVPQATIVPPPRVPQARIPPPWLQPQGQSSLAPAVPSTQARSMFQLADTDGDGRLNRDEFAAFLAANAGRRVSPTQVGGPRRATLHPDAAGDRRLACRPIALPPIPRAATRTVLPPLSTAIPMPSPGSRSVIHPIDSSQPGGRADLLRASASSGRRVSSRTATLRVVPSDVSVVSASNVNMRR